MAARAERLGVAGSVHLLGERGADEVHRLLAAADLFVLPSRAEGISNALLEAMATGLPMVASDIPGNRDVVSDGGDGLLVAAGGGEALSAALGRLLDEPAQRAALGAAARRTVEGRFSLARTADRYLEVLGELVAPAP